MRMSEGKLKREYLEKERQGERAICVIRGRRGERYSPALDGEGALLGEGELICAELLRPHRRDECLRRRQLHGRRLIVIMSTRLARKMKHHNTERGDYNDKRECETGEVNEGMERE